MIGIGIKNAILMMLIILILHFLLKNMLLEKKVLQEDKDEIKAEIKAMIKPENQLEEIIPEEKKKVDDLLKFVMETPMPEEEGLEKFFEPLPSEQPLDESYNIACDSNLDNKEAIEKSMKMPKRPNEDINNSFLVLHEYNDENVMNGGMLGGLGGYDEYGMHYEAYHSSCSQDLV